MSKPADIERLLIVLGTVLCLSILAGLALAGTAAAADSPSCDGVAYDGDGNATNPFQVDNVDRLQCIDANHTDVGSQTEARHSNYTLVSDIDASGASSWNSGEGFAPLTGFNGTFDGQGNTIQGLVIDRPNEDSVGLFGVLEPGGNVTNVAVVEANITGNNLVGGIVGNNKGTSSNFGTIEQSAVVDSTVESTGSGDGEAGGLVGENNGVIRQSYAIATVSGEDRVGGLVGQDLSDASPSVSSSYSASVIEPKNGKTGEYGGLAGRISGPNGDNLYWDGEIADRNFDSSLPDAGFGSYEDSTDVTRLNTTEMVGAAANGNMSQLGFPSPWETVTGPDAYPILQELDAGPQKYTPAESQITGLEIAGDGNVATVFNVSGKDVNATVENLGDRSGNFTVDLEIENDSGTDVVNENKTTSEIESDGNDTVVFNDVANGLSVGTYGVNVSTEDDEISGSLTVSELGSLNIAEQRVPSYISTGTEGNVSAVVENPGGNSSTYNVSLEILNQSDGVEVSNNTTSQLSPGENETVVFENVTSTLDAGTYGINVSTDDDFLTGNLEVVGSEFNLNLSNTYKNGSDFLITNASAVKLNDPNEEVENLRLDLNVTENGTDVNETELFDDLTVNPIQTGRTRIIEDGERQAEFDDGFDAVRLSWFRDGHEVSLSGGIARDANLSNYTVTFEASMSTRGPTVESQDTQAVEVEGAKDRGAEFNLNFSGEFKPDESFSVTNESAIVLNDPDRVVEEVEILFNVTENGTDVNETELFDDLTVNPIRTGRTRIIEDGERQAEFDEGFDAVRLRQFRNGLEASLTGKMNDTTGEYNITLTMLVDGEAFRGENPITLSRQASPADATTSGNDLSEDGTVYGVDSFTVRLVRDAANDGNNSRNSPFFNGNEPINRSDTIDRLVSWSDTGEIDGSEYSRLEIIEHLVSWNGAQ